MIAISTVSLFAAKTIAAYGINKGLDKIFESEESFSKQLYKVLNKAINEYQKNNKIQDQDGKFAFYKSQILIEEFLKFRLFSNKGYILDENAIQKELEKNPNIIKPSEKEIELFFQIFDKFVKKDEKLKSPSSP